MTKANEFQPALPMRGVTGNNQMAGAILLISTRTPHAGSDDNGTRMPYNDSISTRTPHAGSDF